MDNLGTSILQKTLLSDIPHSAITPEYARYLQYLPLFIIAFFVTLLLTPIVGRVARKLNILNATKTEGNNKFNRYENNERRINPNRVPLLGGLAVVLPLYIAIPIFLGFNSLTVPILVALTILVIFGIIDDAFDLPGTSQFLIQFVASLLVVLVINDLHIIKVPFDGVLNVNWVSWEGSLFNQALSLTFPGDLITVIWIMVCINAVKWVNGLDALMESNLIIAFTMLFIIGVRTEALPIIVISAMLVGGLSSFTIFNLPPAKIFSSATGSLSYGFLIATLSIVNQTKFATTIIILLLPLVDFTFVLVKRFLIYKPRSLKAIIKTPLQLMRMSDTNHLHHQLLKLNLSTRQIVLAEVLITLLIGSVAVLSAEAYRLFIIFAAGLLLGSAILLLHMLAARKKTKDVETAKIEETPESRYSY